MSPAQNINLNNSDGNLILPHRDCKVLPLLFMSLSLVLVLTSSICAKYKGGVYVIFSWILLVVFLGMAELNN